MNNIRITKEFDFEMAHALWNYDGACKNIHGHSYRLFVTVIGNPVENESDSGFGMVIDFKELKSIVNNQIVDIFDHSLVVYRKADGPALAMVKNMYDKVYVFDFQPTCENLVIYFASVLKKHLPGKITLFSIKLYETANSYAEWFTSDNPL